MSDAYANAYANTYAEALLQANGYAGKGGANINADTANADDAGDGFTVADDGSASHKHANGRTYAANVFVDPEGNTQLYCPACGAIKQWDGPSAL